MQVRLHCCARSEIFEDRCLECTLLGIEKLYCAKLGEIAGRGWVSTRELIRVEL